LKPGSYGARMALCLTARQYNHGVLTEALAGAIATKAIAGSSGFGRSTFATCCAELLDLFFLNPLLELVSILHSCYRLRCDEFLTARLMKRDRHVTVACPQRCSEARSKCKPFRLVIMSLATLSPNSASTIYISVVGFNESTPVPHRFRLSP